MGLFSKKDNFAKLLDEAFSDYQSGRYADCYKKVCEAADAGNGRGLFCKALLLYNDNVNPDSEVLEEPLLELLSKSVEAGYTLAYGAYPTVLDLCGKKAELCQFLSKKCKVNDGAYFMHKAALSFSMYDDREFEEKPLKLYCPKAVELLRLDLDNLMAKKSIPLMEYDEYSPYSVLSIPSLYARAQHLLMTLYYCDGNWNARSAFMDSFNEAMKYMTDANERYRTAKLYVQAVIENQLGMRDFQEGNRAMGICNDAYKALRDEEKEVFSEGYDELYQAYETFYDEERERLGNREVYHSDGYADKNDISFGKVIAAIGQGLSSYANSSSNSSSTTVYTIGGKEYTRGEFGYLYDSEGFKSGYKVDDYSRLYDEGDRELGYFNTNGNFISN